jgi:hypothetical protein
MAFLRPYQEADKQAMVDVVRQPQIAIVAPAHLTWTICSSVKLPL